MYNFACGSDGSGPDGALIFDRAGNLYGTTSVGGVYFLGGTAFELKPSNGVWVKTILHNFGSGSDGAGPNGALTFDGSGNLYGTTLNGGTYNFGTVFELTSSNGVWTDTVLHNFGSGSDGANPYGTDPLIFDSSGNLYGTTHYGGSHASGIVFELMPSNGTWKENILYSFNGGSDGNQPGAGLISDHSGNLYGTTTLGGASNAGAVFEITGINSGFLHFPLLNKTYLSAKINAIFDHSMQFQYCAHGHVTSYTDENGDMAYPSLAVGTLPFTCYVPKPHSNMLFGYQQAQGKAFSINGQYVGAGHKNYLFYEGHPGYDFRTTDQRLDGSLCSGGLQCNISGQTQVIAAASGVVVCVNISTQLTTQCHEGPGEIKIKHPNGYSTIYMHLSSANVKAGDSVVGGSTSIGVSGNTGTQYPHLHFEVRTNNIPVDPYGWAGARSDPYTRARNVFLW